MDSLIPDEVQAAYDKALAYYAPGGAYGSGVEAGLTRGRKKSTASGMQNLVSAGLAGTTMAAGLGKKYEEEVAAPTRARVEETRVGQMSAIEMAMANMKQSAYGAEQERLARTEEAEKNRKAQQEQLMAQLRSREYLARLSRKATTKKASIFSDFGSSKAPKAVSAPSTSYNDNVVPRIYAGSGSKGIGITYGTRTPTPSRATPTFVGAYSKYVSSARGIGARSQGTASPGEFELMQQRLANKYGFGGSGAYSNY